MRLPTLRSPLLLAAALIALAACTGSGRSGPEVTPSGAPETAKTGALKAGAAMLQRDAPPDAMDIYLVGFHPMKHDGSHQMEAHHFCRQVNEDFAQCVLFDGNTADSNLTGVEYIISEKLFETLSRSERQYWHPHNGEILSGMLVAPGLPAAAERELMRTKMNSYGKTWHTWNASRSTVAGDGLPLGEPGLAWSFNRSGEADPGLVARRDRRMGIDTEERRRARQELESLARPQEGVDAMRKGFTGPTQPIPGVVDRDEPLRRTSTLKE